MGRRLWDEGLPPPRARYHLAAAARTALALQRDPARSLEAHALALGYSERKTIVRQLGATFGARPRAVRQTIGWEPWVSRWLAVKSANGYFPRSSGPILMLAGAVPDTPR